MVPPGVLSRDLPIQRPQCNPLGHWAYFFYYNYVVSPLYVVLFFNNLGTIYLIWLFYSLKTNVKGKFRIRTRHLSILWIRKTIDNLYAVLTITYNVQKHLTEFHHIITFIHWYKSRFYIIYSVLQRWTLKNHHRNNFIMPKNSYEYGNSHHIC